MNWLAYRIAVITVCHNIDDAYTQIAASAPDLVFPDIDLGAGENVFDLLRKFEHVNFGVIFTTQHTTTSNVIGAIRVCAIDFLPKPLLKAELEHALKRYEEHASTRIAQVNTLKSNIESANQQVTAFWIPGTDGRTKVETANVIYCKSENTYTHLHLAKAVARKQVYTSSESIKEWERRFKHAHIYQIHNRILVNLTYIEKYRPKWSGAEVLLTGGLVPDVSRSRKDELKKRLKLLTNSA